MTHGDRINFNPPAAAPYTDPETGVAATLLISEEIYKLILIMMAFLILLVRKLKMALIYGNNPCPAEIAQTFSYWTIAGRK